MHFNRLSIQFNQSKQLLRKCICFQRDALNREGKNCPSVILSLQGHKQPEIEYDVKCNLQIELIQTLNIITVEWSNFILNTQFNGTESYFKKFRLILTNWLKESSGVIVAFLKKVALTKALSLNIDIVRNKKEKVRRRDYVVMREIPGPY